MMQLPSVAPSLIIGVDSPGSLIEREVLGQHQIPLHDVLDRFFDFIECECAAFFGETTGMPCGRDHGLGGTFAKPECRQGNHAGDRFLALSCRIRALDFAVFFRQAGVLNGIDEIRATGEGELVEGADL